MNHRKTLLVSLVAATVAVLGTSAMAQTAADNRRDRELMDRQLAQHQSQVQQEERAAAERAERRAEAAQAADAQAAEGQPLAPAAEKEEAAEEE